MADDTSGANYPPELTLIDVLAFFIRWRLPLFLSVAVGTLAGALILTLLPVNKVPAVWSTSSIVKMELSLDNINPLAAGAFPIPPAGYIEAWASDPIRIANLLSLGGDDPQAARAAGQQLLDGGRFAVRLEPDGLTAILEAAPDLAADGVRLMNQILLTLRAEAKAGLRSQAQRLRENLDLVLAAARRGKLTVDLDRATAMTAEADRILSDDYQPFGGKSNQLEVTVVDHRLTAALALLVGLFLIGLLGSLLIEYVQRVRRDPVAMAKLAAAGQRKPGAARVGN